MIAKHFKIIVLTNNRYDRVQNDNLLQTSSGPPVPAINDAIKVNTKSSPPDVSTFPYQI